MRCLKVQKKNGQTALSILKKLNLIHRSFHITPVEDCIMIPLNKPLSSTQKEALTLEVNIFEELKFKVKKIPLRKDPREKLAECIPQSHATYIPRSFDTIGHIAVIELPTELMKYSNPIGDAILNVHKKVRTVLTKEGTTTGDYRLRRYRVLAGENKTETIHLEHKCRYKLDLRKVYFNPRLSFERKRIASQVQSGEVVVDMFAGVGPFSILIAKREIDVKVYSIDANPTAFTYLKENILLNRVAGRVTPLLGDARNIIEKKLEGKADRVIMNLPTSSFDYIPYATKALKKDGGIIHFYCFAREPDPVGVSMKQLRDSANTIPRKIVEIINIRYVRSVAPYLWMMGLDLKIQPQS